METQQQQERLQFIDRTFHLDPQTYIFGGVMANDHLVYQHIDADYTRVDFMKWDIQNIHNVIERQAAKQAFVQNSRYVSEFATVFSDEQFARKGGLACNESMIFQELVNRDLPCTAENISQVIVDLWNQLADNSTYRDNKEASDWRNAQIAEMTGNGEHGFSIQRGGVQKTAYNKDGRKHDPMQGQAQGFSRGISGPWSRGAGSKSFAEMSNEEVDALYQEWKTTSDLRSMSVEDLRILVKSNGTTDIFGKNVKVPSVVAPDSQDRLYHPQSGEAFTQKSLIRYINAAPYNGRDLITRNGRIVPKLRQLFETTVRGELG